MSADDDSKNPESEASTGQPDRLTLVESRIDSNVEYVERLEERLGQEEAKRHAEIESLREELTAEREARQDLAERVAELEDATDLLRLVDRVDAADGPMRSAALLQHLRRKVKRRQRDGNDPVAEVDREAAKEALHHPNIHRTTLYSDMERVAGWFNNGVCRYADGRLRLDLTDTRGELPHPTKSVDAPQQDQGVGGGSDPPKPVVERKSS